MVEDLLRRCFKRPDLSPKPDGGEAVNWPDVARTLGAFKSHMGEPLYNALSGDKSREPNYQVDTSEPETVELQGGARVRRITTKETWNYNGGVGTRTTKIYSDGVVSVTYDKAPSNSDDPHLHMTADANEQKLNLTLLCSQELIGSNPWKPTIPRNAATQPFVDAVIAELPYNAEIKAELEVKTINGIKIPTWNYRAQVGGKDVIVGRNREIIRYGRW